mgnify:CR=1 FL=1
MTKQNENKALETKVIELVQSSTSFVKVADKNNSLILDSALLYNVVIFKLYSKGPSKEEMESLNKIHLSKLNKNTMQKVSSLANREKLNNIISKCENKDLETVKKAVEKSTGEKSLARIKKACSEPKEKVKPVEAKTARLTDEYQVVAGMIQLLLQATPAEQYKAKTWLMNNIKPRGIDSENVIPSDALAQVIALVPQIFGPALDQTT